GMGPRSPGILFFFQAEDGIRDFHVTGVQTCALPISKPPAAPLDGAGGARTRGAAGGFAGPVSAGCGAAGVAAGPYQYSTLYAAEIGRASCRERVARSGEGGSVEKRTSVEGARQMTSK